MPAKSEGDDFVLWNITIWLLDHTSVGAEVQFATRWCSSRLEGMVPLLSRVFCSEARHEQPITRDSITSAEASPMSNRVFVTLVSPQTRFSGRDPQLSEIARRLALVAILVVAAALAPMASAQAQDPPQSPPAGERLDPRQVIDLRMAKMTETLKLDSAQQTRIRWILADETMQMQALRKNSGGQGGGGGGGGGRGGRGGGMGGRGGGRRGGAPPDSTGSGAGRGGSGGQSPEMRALRDRTNKQIEAVLTAPQVTTYHQLFEGQQQQPSGSGSTSLREDGSSSQPAWATFKSRVVV
jgi:hypothetical protein